MKIYAQAAAAAVLAFLAGGAAEATPITYTFTGTAATVTGAPGGELGGTGGNNASSGILFVPDTGGTAFTNFTVTLTGDTSAVTGVGLLSNSATATFTSGVLSATFTLPTRVIDNQGAGIITFGENQLAPVFFVAEGLTAGAFTSYDLATSLGLTSGGLSVQPQIFSTSLGDLEFDNITALSFQATTDAVPEPASLVMVGIGFLGVGARRWRKRRQ